MTCLQQSMLVLAFLCTWHVCHNYKKRLYNRNVLLRVRPWDAGTTSNFSSISFSKELVLYTFVKAKKGEKKKQKQKQKKKFYKLEVCEYQILYWISNTDNNFLQIELNIFVLMCKKHQNIAMKKER